VHASSNLAAPVPLLLVFRSTGRSRSAASLVNDRPRNIERYGPVRSGPDQSSRPWNDRNENRKKSVSRSGPPVLTGPCPSLLPSPFSRSSMSSVWSHVEYDSLAFYVLAHHLLCAFVLAAPFQFLLDAPFGRFSTRSRFNVNANLGWFLMEIISPISFIVALASPSLAEATFGSQCPSLSRLARLPLPSLILSALFLTHYANRAVISVLRQPASRSPMNIITPLMAVLFNIPNGTLMGSWLGGRTWSSIGGVPDQALSQPLFWFGVALWAAGFASNVAHDEILRRLRLPTATRPNPPQYSIPHGLLFDYPLGGVSSPAYLSEWVEWLGFALACSATTLHAPPLPHISPDRYNHPISSLMFQYVPILRSNSTLLIPPFIFFFLEVVLMLPRALSTHKWYHDKFRDSYPKQRRAVFPGVL
jgi:3-oxo-5-alpha-steroid 4-dehydrogenase 1